MGLYEGAVELMLLAGLRSVAEIRRRLEAEHGMPAGSVADSTLRGFVGRRVAGMAVVRKPRRGGSYDSTSGLQEYYTPPEVFEALGLQFDVDAAAPGVGGVPLPVIATPARRFITPDLDAMAPTTSWGTGATRVWLNPPYDRISAFLQRAVKSVAAGGSVLALLPSRTDSGWWSSIVMQEATAVLFARRRIHFNTALGRAGSPAFGSVFVMLGEDAAMLDSLERSGLGPVVRLHGGAGEGGEAAGGAGDDGAITHEDEAEAA